MKNDIKTKSTDFLPPKPGDNSGNQPADSTNPAPATDPAQSPTTSPADDTAKPAGPQMPTSAHVIDLKNQSADAGSNNEFMEKNNPFLKKPGPEPTAPPEPAKSEAASVSVKTEPANKMPEPPKPEAETPPMPTIDTPGEADKPPTVDLSHPDQGAEADQKDALKDAMVKDDPAAKPKKKLPVWLLVIIIVVAVVVIAIATFAVLNFLARPTGV